LLRLFPRDYRASFQAEMTAAFEQAGAERRALGRFAYLRFAMAELAGVAVRAPLEWIAKMTTSGTVRGRSVPDVRMMRPAGVPRQLWFSQLHPDTEPDQIAEVERRVEFCLRRMEHAIATHDFEGARFYSIQDLEARERLRLLRARQSLGG
jgi:hypothetical protein